GKKCLRCGRYHTVSHILNSGEIVNGITTAVEMVKKRQAEFGKKELGHIPEFRAFGDFTVAVKKSKGLTENNEESNEETTSQFKNVLKEIASAYKKFPLYVIEVMAEEYGIVRSKLKHLTKCFQKKGILIRLDDYFYTIKEEI
ncbi:MAG: hypothetical protein ACFFBC_14585, partial [Promethearchaeota archaeon]